MNIRIKRLKQSSAGLLAAVLISYCLSGCWANIPDNRNRIYAPADSGSAPTNPLPTAEDTPRNEEIPMGRIFPSHSAFIQSGTLNYTVTGSRVLGPDSNVTFSIDRFFPYTFIPSVAQYPDFLDETGHLSPGCYMVQADITVENVDAQTIEEEYGDPCLFRADDLFLINLDASGGYRNVDYFSLAGEYKAHPMLYRLEPGNTTQYTIGFLTDEAWAVEGTSGLRVSQSSSPNYLKVDLQLGGGGHE